jgi:hypothetical protein
MNDGEGEEQAKQVTGPADAEFPEVAPKAPAAAPATESKSAPHA